VQPVTDAVPVVLAPHIHFSCRIYVYSVHFCPRRTRWPLFILFFLFFLFNSWRPWTFYSSIATLPPFLVSSEMRYGYAVNVDSRECEVGPQGEVRSRHESKPPHQTLIRTRISTPADPRLALVCYLPDSKPDARHFHLFLLPSPHNFISRSVTLASRISGCLLILSSSR
jgi:hypothetical protein